jgi:serine/threonine protein kinase
LRASDPRLERDLSHALRLERQSVEQPAVETADHPTESPIGQRVSHYRIVERIGGGGMGVVYKAEDTRLGRPVALKFISDELSRDPEALGRFAREARMASALNHPNICTIHDIGEQDGRSFIVLEHLKGMTLKDRLAGSLSLEKVVDVGTQIADALDAAHTAGIVHRDIKPANLFIGPRDHVTVLDFGLAKMRAPAIHQSEVTTMAGTRQGVVMGTAGYMAPEQAGGQRVDHRADIWSLGVVLYEMATGTRPAPGVRLSVKGTPELERIIAKCLETDRDLRYQHASELRTELERLRRGSGPAVDPRPGLVRRRMAWAAGAAAVLLILITAAVASFLYGRRPAPLTERDTLVLAEFTNTTGDPVFDETLRQGLSVQLRQSPFLSLISDDRVRMTLALMDQPAEARLTPEVAQGVCVRTASAAVIEGSIPVVEEARAEYARLP